MKINNVELKPGEYKLHMSWDYFEIFDKNGNPVYYQHLKGGWDKICYDERGNETYYKDSDGFWRITEYDEQDNETYYKDSYGTIRDNRVKEVTLAEIAEKFGVKNVKVVE